MTFEPAIDKRTEEKMLFGTLDPEDAPPELARVALFLRAASAPRAGVDSTSTVTESDRARQDRVVASMVAAIGAADAVAAPHGAPVRAGARPFWKVMGRSVAQPSRLWKLRGGAFGRARLVVTMALGLMLASASLAFAGVLPSPAQHVASVLLSKVGVHVPDHEHDGTTPSGHEPGDVREPGSSNDHPGDTTGGDQGNGKDRGKHTGQEKNGNSGKHKGQDKHGTNKGGAGDGGDQGKQKGQDGSGGDDNGKGDGGDSGASSGSGGDRSGHGGGSGEDGHSSGNGDDGS